MIEVLIEDVRLFVDVAGKKQVLFVTNVGTSESHCLIAYSDTMNFCLLGPSNAQLTN